MSWGVAGPVCTLATGPAGTSPATLAALSQPVLHHTDPAFRGTGVIMAITGYLATVVSANFVLDVSDFISFLLYIVIPWSAINLVDYYVVRRGRYDVGAIFTPNGRYGAVNWRTIGVFLVGIAVEIPFMNASYLQFEGPAATPVTEVAAD